MTPSTRGQPPEPSPLRRWLAPPFTAFVFGLHLVVVLAHPGGLLQDPGTGWHLATGRYILETGTIPAGDFFSFTAAGHEWINFCWLFEVASAILVRWGGLPLFATTCMLAYAFLPVLVFRRSLRIGAGIVPALGATLLAYFVLISHSLARPHIVTYLFFALALERLEDFQDGRRSARALWSLPLLALLWANMHGGFFAGFVLTGIFAGVASVAALTSPDREVGRQALVFAGVLGAMVLATLVNPWGWRLHASILDTLGTRSVRYFIDFQSPNFLSPSMSVRAFEALALLVVVLLARRGRRLGWLEVVLLAFFLHEGLQSQRHMNLFAIVAAPIVARELTPFLATLWPRLHVRWLEIGRQQGALRSPLVYFPLLCVALMVLSLRHAVSFPETLDDLQLTRGAAEFIARHEDRFRRPFNTDGLGGSLIYRFWPRVRVFVDDRVSIYGDDFMLHRYFPVAWAGRSWKKVLDKYRVTAAVVAADAQCTTLLRASPDWELAYQDKKNVIFLRRDVSGEPASAGRAWFASEDRMNAIFFRRGASGGSVE
ncbi:MAG: hypothetical protein DMD97_00485 [Candidatus Rokuibacteriota bacterium]|nr:MAG: hypothetical protein DMD97_00485 [Candidatus Rokubacteria bacterium]